MKNLRKTNIVGTIGPASESEETLTKLISAGLNVTRINFSHGGYEDNKEKIETIKKVREKLNKPVALLLDTKGPEIRTGMQESGDEKVTIKEGQTFTFYNDDIIGNETKTSISYKNLYKEVKVGSTLLVDDGALEFEITKIDGKDIVCKALNTGRLGSRKTMNVPGVKLELPALTEKDIEDIKNGIKAGFDYIAASFVRKVEDVQAIRNLLDANGGEKVRIISKIENQEGIDNFEEILQASDGIMVARGDMGVEIPMEEVPVVQKYFIQRCAEVGKPVITATQMLESMISNPRPTRAEVSDVANAVYDITGAIMLSGECALGKYAVECVEVMDKIALRVENDVSYWKRFDRRRNRISTDDITGNIAYSMCLNAKNVDAKAIVAYANTGSTVRRIASMHPGCPIFAVTADEKTFHQLSLDFDVYPILIPENKSIDVLLEEGIDKLLKAGYIEKNDLIVISGGNNILADSTFVNRVVGGILRV